MAHGRRVFADNAFLGIVGGRIAEFRDQHAVNLCQQRRNIGMNVVQNNHLFRRTVQQRVIFTVE